MTPDLFPKLILILFFLGVGFPVHEFAHAFAAWRLGDGTAKLFGRLTLNPIAHFDPFGAVMLVVSVFFGGIVIGWAKPTPVNTANLRDRRNGEVIVAVAGPLSNLLMATVGAFLFRFLAGATVASPVEVPVQVFILLVYFVGFNVALAVFNLLPIPPLDGATLLYRFVSLETAWKLRPLLAQYGVYALLILVFLGGPILSRLIGAIVNLLIGQPVY